MASRVLKAIGEIARHWPVVRRDPLGALDVLTPSDGVRCIADIEYGQHGGQRLDLYFPRNGPSPASAVVFFHGGRWSYGRKDEYRFVAHALVARGHAVAVCDYRKYPAVRFPSFVEDGAAAIAWAMRHLPNGPADGPGRSGHGVDPRLIFLMGHSAGAHIAALATMDRRYSAVHGIEPDDVAGLVLMSGPFDFFPIKGEELRDIFGPAENHAETQPLRFVRRGLPPMLLLHGRRDRTVRPRSSAMLASAIRENGGEARVIFYDFVTHTNILAALSDRIGFLVAPALEDIGAFLQRRIAEITSPPAG
ncbi:MAG TPA: alpha/beta hydrolase [Candidatus Limnocylindrales bacterium]|nr:alpha/beta hydrolase [Candidatus Limnocylindrales bacterium]